MDALSYIIDLTQPRLEVPEPPISISEHRYKVSYTPIKISELPSASLISSQLETYDYYRSRPDTKVFISYNGTAVESLLNVSQGSNYSLSGNYIHDLFSAQAELLAARQKAQEEFDKYFEFLRDPSFGWVNVLPTYEDLDAFISAQPVYSYTPPIGILKYLEISKLTASLLRSVRTRITLVRKAIAKTVPRFCAVSWARRKWFLMHGTRPPKVEALFKQMPPFECA